MACRCAEISQYEADIAVMEDMLSKIAELEGKDDEIGQCMDGIANALPSTLIVPDETFCANVKNFNTSTRAHISQLKYSINSSKNRATDKLEEMRQEDKEAHPSAWDTFWHWVTGG